MNPQLEKLLTFLKNHNVATIATVSDKGKPHATTIYYFVDDKLNFHFVTKDATIKYKNISSNNSVAIVVSDTSTLQTVQMEGIATQIEKPHELTQTISDLAQASLKDVGKWSNVPISRIQKGHYQFFRAKPNWLRFVDFKDWENIVQFEQYL